MAGAVELVPAGTSLVSAGASPSRALTPVPSPRATPSRWQRVRPPVLALTLTLAALALHALVLRGAVPWAQSIALGAAMVAAGLGWMAWAASTLRRAGTPLPSIAKPKVLVDDGPYRFGRNPIYLGMVVTMLGIGVAAGAPLMLVAAANFVAIVSSVHIVHEEANLRRAFGGWYSDYAASVRRWI
jgi:protein-S-isoprenylcysteine O-methyltransferase Ste14